MTEEMINKIAAKVEGEGSVFVGKNHNALVAIAQCIKDIYETKLLGDVSIDTVLDKAFNAPACTPSEEARQAVKEVFEQGIRRFPNARILQFRSFTNYSDKNGQPDKNKLKNLFENYDYLGSDSINNEWGHFYFGRKEILSMKKLALIIDPGHYPGYNPGIDPAVCEGDVMYSLAEAEKKYCDAKYSNQVDCILTRGMNEDPSLEQGRGHKAVEMKQSGNYETVMFMSDHTNAPGGNPPDPNVTGICIFTSQFRKNTYDFLQKLADVAASVMNSHFLYMDAQPLSAADPADWWGVVRGAMNHAKTQQEADQNGADYAFIIEHGFHTNPVECAFFKSQKNIQRMAEAKIDFIMEYLGIKKAATMTAFWLCDGTLEITYAGADGVNLHSGLKMVSTNVVGILYKGEKRRVVQGVKMSDGQDWYRLESGEYITANKNYVKYAENNQKKKVGKVTGVAANDVLNVRDFPNSYSGNVTRTLKEGNLVQVIGECYNNGTQWYLVDQGDASNKFKGFVAARYIK